MKKKSLIPRQKMSERHHLPGELQDLWREINVVAAERGLKVERVVATEDGMPGCLFFRILIGKVGGGKLTGDGNQPRNNSIRAIDGDRLELADLPAARRKYVRILDCVANFHVWLEGLPQRQGASGEFHTLHEAN